MEIKTINGYDIKDETARNNIETLSDSYIIAEITTEEFYDEDTNTHYFITHVPNKDSKGNPIRLKHGFANDEDSYEAIANDTAREFACRNNATFCVNASIFGINSIYENYLHCMGTMIKDGELISQYNNDGYTDETKNRMRILGVKSDNTLEEYPFNSSYESLINDGCVNTFSGYGCCMKNGVILTQSTEQNIWNLIAQNTITKDLYFICCNGRDINNEEGMSQITLCEILRDNYNCDFAFRIDAGGSTCFVKDCVMLNTPYDDFGVNIRQTPDYIYFSKDKETVNDYNINEILNFISETKSKVDSVYNRLYYLYNIHNNRLNFNFPNIRTTTESGIRFRYTKDDILKSQILFDTNEKPLALSIYDNVNNKTVARIDGENEEFILNNKILGGFFRTAYNVNDANSAINSGFYRIPGNATNSPFPSGTGGVLIVIRGESGGVRQIAIPQVSDSTSRSWYTRQSNQDIDTWETWKQILTPTNVS